MSLPPHILRSLEDHTRVLKLLENPQDYPGLPPRRLSRILLRIWRYPSFEPQCSWAIIEGKEGLFLRRVVLDAARDFTYGSETPFERANYDHLMAELEGILVAPFVTDKRVGLDGTSYGIERFEFGASARLSWWESPPPDWTDLQRWHQKAAELFDSALPRSTDEVNNEPLH